MILNKSKPNDSYEATMPKKNCSKFDFFFWLYIEDCDSILMRAILLL